jgi:hypothetical protein
MAPTKINWQELLGQDEIPAPLAIPCLCLPPPLGLVASGIANEKEGRGQETHG